jgi:UPF0755 protein
MAKRPIRGLVLSVAAVLLCLLGGGGALYYLNSPVPGIPPEGRVVRVLKGETLSSIAARLHQEGLIRSPSWLKLLSRIRHSGSSFKSGYYLVKPGDTTVDIHDLLVSGYQEQLKVTIPEGWTLRKIAAHMQAKGVASEREFLEAASSPVLLKRFGIPAENLEGYLFPDTYFFPPGYPAYAVVEEMVDRFFEQLEVIAPEYRQRQAAELHRTVILASIVEREYRRPEEAALIASVFNNRLKYNIGLESCATLEYIITDIELKPHPQFLTAEDKRIDSPYNTYKWAGLPPGPISNPGRVALEAAFRPAQTNYYYFVLKDPETGEHYFSESLREHNWAKYNYLKSVGSGG